MIDARIKVEDEQTDEQMTMLSWQTAILINVSGNVKKKYKPTDLYKPLAQQKEEAKEKRQSKGGLTKLSEAEFKRKQQELRERFGL